MLKVLETVYNYLNDTKERTSPNNDFICPLCHEHDYIPSTITMQANYGSIYDGERMKIQLCGECFDMLWNLASVGLKSEEKECD